MSDQRDRLAGLLCRTQEWCDGTCPDVEGASAIRGHHADVLLAAGVTVGLDVERLAKALHLNAHNHSGLPASADATCGPTKTDRAHAAAIAAEYDQLRGQS